MVGQDGFHLRDHGIHVATIHRNLPVPKLYEHAMKFEPGTAISATGALIAYSGEKTGRSPNDKRIVRHTTSESDVCWGSVNIAQEASDFDATRRLAADHLNSCERLYCVDAFAGWDPSHRIKIRVICTRPYQALFIYTMLIRPSDEELASFGQPDCVIFNAGQFPAKQGSYGVTSESAVGLDLDRGVMVILGTEYAGEMKKGVFTLVNYLMPKQGVLSMHCSATSDKQGATSSVLFGLSGTGKTTLSADPHRLLVGDDEHCWTDDGIFNIEGGCYAKAINLSAESEPEIYQALRFGSVLENVVYDKRSHHVDFADSSITENTRGAYPIEFISNAKVPCVAGHPRDVIFLTCDAFGVLPPVSRLSPEQAMYHFISGYTAKVAGTEVGITEPQATFSACFGGPFLVWHPGKYAEMLAERMKKHGANVWLVNTGWTGGPYGVGSRMKLSHTRSIIDAIHSGALMNARTQKDPVFALPVVTECPNVPPEPLVPKNTWADGAGFDATAKKLAGLFIENFKKYEAGVPEAVRHAGPTI